ncbi:hypothetical protein EZS27_019945, partial [termite gut metagenome]
VETLEASGRWFKEHFSVTPPTAFSVLSDVRNEGNKTVWFNSRYYRANLLWKGKSFRFRDIHLFDENFESDYLTKAGTSSQCVYTTLPVVDGFLWSTQSELAGLRIVDKNGNDLEFGEPTVNRLSENVLHVEFSTTSGQTFSIIFYEDRFEVACTKGKKDMAWAFELKTASGKELPFREINENKIKAFFNGFEYTITCKKGKVGKVQGSAFRIVPIGNKIVMSLRK